MSRRRTQKEPSKFGAYFMMGSMVFLMVASMASVMLYAPPTQQDIEYNGKTFSVENNLYVADGKSFVNLPFAALSVPTDPEAINILKTSPLIVLTFNPEANDLALVDLIRFELATVIPGLGGAVTASSDTYALPVITCADASVQQPVLFLKESTQPAIRRVDYCVTLEGNVSSLILAKDALLYHYYDMFTIEDLQRISLPEPLTLDEVMDPSAIGVNESLDSIFFIGGDDQDLFAQEEQ